MRVEEEARALKEEDAHHCDEEGEEQQDDEEIHPAVTQDLGHMGAFVLAYEEPRAGCGTILTSKKPDGIDAPWLRHLSKYMIMTNK